MNEQLEKEIEEVKRDADEIVNFVKENFEDMESNIVEAVDEESEKEIVLTAADVKDAMIYIGPTIKGTGLNNFTVYIGGVPKEYKNHKVFKHLFVELVFDKVNEAMAELKREGSKLRYFYELALRGGK